MRDMTVERSRQAEMNRDIALASRVQRVLLPEVSDSPFVSIRTLYHPSNNVSGDSYYLAWHKKRNFLSGFLVDVTGHGLATALQTASINVMMREIGYLKLPLLEQMKLLNERAAAYFSEGSYAALMGFEMDPSAMELRYVAAGITQFYKNGIEISTPGMFVGMINDAEFGTGVISISEGDCVFFLTDGFTDRLNQPENANFWSQNGKDFDADVAALEELASKGNLKDDATGLCFKINGGKLQ